MTHPSPVPTALDSDRPLSIGAALSFALAGRTDNFVMVVGYFGHGGRSAFFNAPHDLYDPVALLLGELADTTDQVIATRPRFQLLFGGVVSEASSLALELWWWLCRWHVAAPPVADAWRARILSELPTNSSRDKLVDLIHRLFASGSPVRLPLLDAEQPDTVALRATLSDREAAALAIVRAKTKAKFGDRKTPGPLAVQTGSLLLYLLQRDAEVRYGARQAAAQSLRIFHPKIYVVERGATDDTPADAFVFAGSANWSAVALDPSADANVEVATAHRVSGAPFSERRDPPAPASLGADLAATARALFDAAPVFACWIAVDGQSSCCDVEQLEALLEIPEHLRERTSYDAPGKPEDSASDDPGFTLPEVNHRRFAQALCRDIEIALGLDARTLTSTIHTLDALEHAWHGKQPAAYQLDGAARLLALLQHNRGAMLTDEPGLGKTLVAQLVIAALIRERLLFRRELSQAQGVAIDSLPPIRVSVLAPARVLGRGGRSESATQWFRHAAEIRSAVRSALANEPSLQALVDRRDFLRIELFSNQSLSRSLYEKHSTELRDEVLSDLHHLACSELVVVDEAHNFRNGGSRATRLLRFCLSLATWGESDWRVRQTTTGELFDEDASDDIEPKPPSSTGRKILLLSATPFNNRIQDVSTQLGHFAKAQEWADRPGDLADALARRVDEIPADPVYWTSELATKRKPTARADLARMLEAIAVKHIPGSRALDIDDVKAQDRQLKGSELARARDGGPIYRWTGPHVVLGRIFAAIGQMLAAERTGQPASRGLQVDTRARIDAMLLGYVVQRSRRQVLDFIHRVEGPEVCAEMFRAPMQPRAPLAIRSKDESESDEVTQEREILEELFTLILDGEDGVSHGRLSLLAYELRYLRGFDRGGGTGARTVGASNFVAFQTINLVKRLQSCSYAFLMTLVRGLLRTNLYELALVEALVNPESRSHGPKQQVLALPEDRTEQLGLARIGCERAAVALRDRLEQSPRREQLRRLLGLDKRNRNATDNTGIFADLIGLAADEQLAARFEDDLDLARDYLVVGLKGRKGRKGRAADSEVTSSHWVERLLEDLVQRPESKAELGSKIATDAMLCLDWVFGESRSEGLLEIVYEGLKGWVGLPMAKVAELVTSSDDAITWLEARVRLDRRATDLLAWLLGQTAVRLAAQRDPSAREHAPGGDRSLVFSEYADTIDYLRVLLGALHHSAARFLGEAPGDRDLSVKQRKRVRELLEDLRDRAPNVCVSLAEDACATLASLGKTDGALLPPPLDPTQVEALLRTPEDVARVALALVEHAAIVTSRVATGQRLIREESDTKIDEVPVQETFVADASYDDELDPEVGAGSSVDDAPALDAFSPWYQVDVTSVGVAEGVGDAVAARLATAQRNPVYTLLSTEVLAEGVNLQECGVAVHYDLPWNPTRLIQRNGRVDRRIDVRVEQAEKRTELAEQLVAAAAEAGTPVEINPTVFWAPRNVYHLTVPPIEPKLDNARRTAFAKRVRAVLFDKLSGIRRLFGLSAWPVVLGADDARGALDGSLAYETPAFHRREQLFLRWRALREQVIREDGDPALRYGAFVCVMRADAMARLHAELVGSSEGLDTSRFESLALSFWSREQPRSIPLRSGIDIAPFTVTDDDGRRAFAARWRASIDDTGGVLALALIGEELLAWRITKALLPTKGRRTTLEACAIAREQVVVLSRQPTVNWATLATAQPADEPVGPNSPTATVEIALDYLAQALLEGDDVPQIVELPDGRPFPTQWDDLTRHRHLGALLRRPLEEFSKHNSSPTPSATEPDGFNIIVSRRLM